MPNFSLTNKVTVHYTGKFEDGGVFDTTEGRAPLTYIEGAHEVVPGFEAAVAGMRPGERKTVTLEPREAYGERRPRAISESHRADSQLRRPRCGPAHLP